MYSTSSGQRRGLLRPHSSSHSGPVFRNLPLFGFLAGLVLFFYIFYIYQAQNAELTLAREQNDLQALEMHKVKDELTDTKALLEKKKIEAESNLVKANQEKSSAEEKLKTCTTLTENQKSEISKLETEKQEHSDKLQAVKKQLEQLNDTLAAMRTVNQNNEETIRRLNKTITELQDQLQKTRSAALPVAENMVAKGNANVGNQDVIRQRIMGMKTTAPQPVNDLRPQESNLHNRVEQDLAANDLAPAKHKEDVPAAKAPTVPAAPVQREADGNVIAPPIPPADHDEQPVKKLDADAEKRNNVAGRDVEKNGNDDAEDGKSVILGKDYRNSAEEAGLRAQENKLKPNEDGVMDFENDDKKN